MSEPAQILVLGLSTPQKAQGPLGIFLIPRVPVDTDSEGMVRRPAVMAPWSL